MNLTVKTLKGGKFTIEVEATSTVAQVKTVIVSFRSRELFYYLNDKVKDGVRVL